MRFSAVLFSLLLAAGALAAQISPAERTRMRETRDTMRSLAQDLRAYRLAHEAYPHQLEALLEANLRESIPKDGWGRELLYQLDEEEGYRLVSLGEDGAEGGEGAAADIVWTSGGEKQHLTEAQEEKLEARRDAQRHEARVALSQARMIIVGRELAKYRKRHGHWPEELQDAAREGASTEDKAVNLCFRDAWGNPLEFRVLPADNIAVICRGANGEPGGADRDADFVISERDIRAHVRAANSWNPWRRMGFDWQIESLAGDVESFRRKHGRLPEDLNELTRGGPGVAIRDSIPTDRWDNEYVYIRLDEENFVVVGLGRDQLAGGADEDRDVIMPQPGGTPEGGRRATRVVFPAAQDPAIEAREQNELLRRIAKEQLAAIAEALSRYQADNGTWPESLDEIAALLPGEEVPLDPWDNAFHYLLTRDEEGNVNGFQLTCLGADGQVGGSEAGADIVFTQDGLQAPSAEPEEAGPADGEIGEPAAAPERRFR